MKTKKPTWHQRYKNMKKGLGMTNADISKITGNTPDSIKTATRPNHELARWLKFAIVVYETCSGDTLKN